MGDALSVFLRSADGENTIVNVLNAVGVMVLAGEVSVPMVQGSCS